LQVLHGQLASMRVVLGYFWRRARRSSKSVDAMLG
jgi:hypothetical protein